MLRAGRWGGLVLIQHAHMGAAAKVDPFTKNPVELCFHWMEGERMDASGGCPCTDGAAENPWEKIESEMTEEEKQLERLAEPIMNMGFSRCSAHSRSR
jgi:hypothetical protein